MNTAARTLAEYQSVSGQLSSLLNSKQVLIPLVLIGLVFISAFALVYEREYYRHVFSDLQQVQAESIQLQSQSQQLLLESTTWARTERVQSLAENALQMVVPDQTQWVAIKP